MQDVAGHLPFLYVKPFFPIAGSGESLFLSCLAFVGFMAHLLLINMVVGTMFITLWNAVRPVKYGATKQSPFAPSLEMAILPKCLALAVNIGVVPFLLLQLLYGTSLYISNLLGARYWILLPFIIIVAYYGLYFYGSSLGVSRLWRNVALFVSAVLLTAVLCFFVSNMTIMSNPWLWLQFAFDQQGTILATADPQFIPRCLHILLASVAIAGLAQAALAARAIRKFEKKHQGAEELFLATPKMRQGLQIFVFMTALQPLVGGWFFFSLPKPVQHLFLGGHFIATLSFTAALIAFMASLVFALKRRTLWTVCSAGGIVVCMCSMRLLLKDAELSTASEALYPEFLAESLLFANAPLEGLFVFVGSFIITLLAIVMMLKLYFDRKPALPSERQLFGSKEENGDGLLFDDVNWSGKGA